MGRLRAIMVASSFGLLVVGAADSGAAANRAAGGKATILGFTSAPWVGGVAPQTHSGGKITSCLDTGNGQRQIAVIVRVTGYPKSARIGVGLWGGNSGFQGTYEPQPTLKQIAKSAAPWTAASAVSGVGTGISYANDGYGPVNIDGVWNASVVVDGKVRATGHVTVACSG